MKKRTKLFLLLVTVLVVSACLASFIACDGSKIEVEISKLPQTVYVVGQDLNLADGKLTVKGSSTEISLNSTDVQVEGYDKNKLGEQNLTVSYKGATASFSVTVVERLVVEGYVSDYFQNESFDNSKGNLTLTKDDGTSQTVSLSNAEVAVEGFDSSKAGACNVTFKFGGYSVEKSLNICEASKIILSKPNKTTYQSHETLDLSGSYLTVEDASGNVKKHVVVTEDMLEGFDLSQATVENLSTPLTQEVTVKFAGKTATFNVKITYSVVSLMQLRAQQFSSLSFEGSEYPQISQTDGQNAMDAMTLYFNLSSKQKQEIDVENVSAVAKVATVYGLDAWITELKTYSNTFVTNGKSIYFVGGTKDQAETDMARLSDDSAFISMGSLLHQINYEFADLQLIGEDTVGSYLNGILSPDEYFYALQNLEYMFVLDNLVAQVPQDWTTDKTKIDDVIKSVASKAEMCLGKGVYKTVMNWSGRAEELSNAILTYCYETNDARSLNIVSEFCLPESFDKLYEASFGASLVMYEFEAGDEWDSSMFMWYYKNMLEQTEAILQSDNELYGWLYENLYFDGVSLSDFLNVATLLDFGYYKLCNGFLGDETFGTLWNNYLAIMDEMIQALTNEVDYVPDAKVAALFDEFAAMSPAYQYSFIYSVNPYYGSGYPEWAWDYTDDLSSSLFVETIRDYYKANLPQSAQGVFKNLLLAMEAYSVHFCNVNESQTYLDSFLSYMKEAKSGYESLSAEDKTAFDGSLKNFYDKYTQIYALYSADGSQQGIDLPTVEECGKDWTAVFDSIANSVANIYSYVAVSDLFPAYLPILSEFEHIQTLVDEINNVTDDAVREQLQYAYLYKEYTIVEGVEATDDSPAVQEVVMSLDTAYFYARKSFVDVLTENVMWNYYLSAQNLQQFLADALPVYRMLFNSNYDIANKQDVIAVMNSFYKIPSIERAIFAQLSQDFNYYSVSLVAYFQNNFDVKDESGVVTDASLSNAVKLLLDAEIDFVFYQYYAEYFADSEELAAMQQQFQNSMTKCQGAVSGLSDEYKAIFTEYVGEMYAYYSAEYAKLSQA